jgi:kynureninase
MSSSSYLEQIRSAGRAKFPSNANSVEFARDLDSQDSLRHLRDEFTLPTRGSLKKKNLNGTLPGMFGNWRKRHEARSES